MQGVGWYFPPLIGPGEENYTSNDIEGFKGEDLYVNLARETCQNSLDAQEADTTGPVRVAYRLRKFHPRDYEFFEQYAECLRGCRKYWEARPDGVGDNLRDLLDGADQILEQDSVSALVVSDFNTPGLKGSKGSSGTFTGSFNALIYGEGVSHKDNEKSAGSFGIGRNAPFACSALSCVCYNTLAVDGGNAFVGIAKLASTLNGEGKKTRKQGHYQYNDDDNEIWRPVAPSDADDFSREFSREDGEYGTDVIILGFREEEDWRQKLEEAILRNFFLAIHNNQLVVEIEGKVIDSQSIGGMLDGYAEGADKEMRKVVQYYRALIDPSSDRCSLSILEDNDAELIIRTDPEVEAFKSVAWFRSSGMLIRPYKPTGIFQPYVCVFVVKGDLLDKTLRKTEPARHNDWDYRRVDANEKELKSRARKAITILKREIKKSLKDKCETVADETIDAVGAAAYLADDVDRSEQEPGGTDILRPIIKIGKARKSKPSPPRPEPIGAKKDNGAETAGEVRNNTRHRDAKPDDDPTPAVKPGAGDTSGAAPGKGSKTVISPLNCRIRPVPISYTNGLYKVIIVPQEDSSDVMLSCAAVGENGNRDALTVETATVDGKRIPVSKDSLIGPFGVKAGERYELFVRFAEHDKLALSVTMHSKG